MIGNHVALGLEHQVFSLLFILQTVGLAVVHGLVSLGQHILRLLLQLQIREHGGGGVAVPHLTVELVGQLPVGVGPLLVGGAVLIHEIPVLGHVVLIGHIVLFD